MKLPKSERHYRVKRPPAPKICMCGHMKGSHSWVREQRSCVGKCLAPDGICHSYGVPI